MKQATVETGELPQNPYVLVVGCPRSGTTLLQRMSQFAGRDLELFEALPGELLGETGYEGAVDRISPDVAAVAERCEQWWANKR